MQTLISGDLDSIHKDVLEHYKDKCLVIKTPDQDYTDFTKALRVVSTQDNIKVDYFLAFAEHNGRLDQIFGNLQTLYEVQDLGTPVLILSSHSIEWLLQPGKHTIHIPRHNQGIYIRYVLLRALLRITFFHF